MSLWMAALAQGAILGYALVGGVFLTFSDFLMRSLAKTSGAGGIEAMQSINREVFRWVFMSLFLGLAPVSLWFCAYALLWAENGSAAPLGVAGGLYLVGCFLVTAAGNVPMNEALARLDPASEEASAYWRGVYLPRWTRLNTLRGLACVAASAVLLLGLFPASSFEN